MNSIRFLITAPSGIDGVYNQKRRFLLEGRLPAFDGDREISFVEIRTMLHRLLDEEMDKIKGQ